MVAQGEHDQSQPQGRQGGPCRGQVFRSCPHTNRMREQPSLEWTWQGLVRAAARDSESEEVQLTLCIHGKRPTILVQAPSRSQNTFFGHHFLALYPGVSLSGLLLVDTCTRVCNRRGAVRPPGAEGHLQ